MACNTLHVDEFNMALLNAVVIERRHSGDARRSEIDWREHM